MILPIYQKTGVHMKNNGSPILFPILVALAAGSMLLSGCQALEPDKGQEINSEIQPSVEDEALPATGLPESSQEPSGKDGSSSPTATIAEQFKPTPRAGLQATDPETVLLASGEIQIVEFFAYWWPTCQSLAPIVHGLESDYYGRVKFNYLDIDDPRNDMFKNQLSYRYQPHIFLLDQEGNVLQQWLGPVGEDQLSAAIDDALRWGINGPGRPGMGFL
jgi:thiol-disulfide isomerase/thioredoxin